MRKQENAKKNMGWHSAFVLVTALALIAAVSTVSLAEGDWQARRTASAVVAERATIDLANSQLTYPHPRDIVSILDEWAPEYSGRCLLGQHNHRLTIEWDADNHVPLVSIDGLPADDCTFQSQVDENGRLTWQWGLVLPGEPLVKGAFGVVQSLNGESVVPVAVVESSGEATRLAPLTREKLEQEVPISVGNCCCFRGNGDCTEKKCKMNDGCGTGACMYDGAVAQ